MNDSKKLAAFLRTAIREGVVNGVEHPFSEAAKRFYADVDVLSVSTAEQWFAANKEQAELVNQVYESYHAEETVEEATQPVQEVADATVSEIEKLQARIKTLEDAQKPTPDPTPTPAAEEPPAQEG